jgi:hypothetical protein
MPVPTNLTIQNLYPGIVAKMQGRSNLGPAASTTALYTIASREAIQELTETYEFEELKVPSPIVTIQMGVSTYSIASFIPTDSTDTEFDLTDIYDWGFWLNPGQQQGPFRIMKYRRVPTVDQYQFGTTNPAPPVYFSRFGAPQGISPAAANFPLVIGPIPDQNYLSFMRFKARHPFTTLIYDSPIYMPDSWQEIIEYSAALRLATWQGATDFVALFRTILFGDPKNPQQPGLVKARYAQMERDANHNERQVTVVMNPYSYGGS